MIIPDHGTAILFFSLSPEVQAKEKHWRGVSKALARKTQSKLFRHTMGIIEQSGLPFIHSDEHHQRGHDFGSKLSNAVEDVFRQGYTSVIILGNDCPQLNEKALNTAFQLLQNKDAVVGPSHTGGVYLMGLQQSKFDRSSFQNLPWQSENLQDALIEYFQKESVKVVLLPFLADLNQYEDLSFFTGLTTIHRDLLQVFDALIQCFFTLRFKYFALITISVPFTPHPHRGPPPSC